MYFAASLGLTDDQREFQRVALDFAKNELAPEMQKWDQEVSDKRVYRTLPAGACSQSNFLES